MSRSRKDPADMLAEHLVKQIVGWAIEWNLDKYTIVGVLEDIKQEFVWEEKSPDGICGDEEEDEDEEDDDDDDDDDEI